MLNLPFAASSIVSAPGQLPRVFTRTCLFYVCSGDGCKAHEVFYHEDSKAGKKKAQKMGSEVEKEREEEAEDAASEIVPKTPARKVPDPEDSVDDIRQVIHLE